MANQMINSSGERIGLPCVHTFSVTENENYSMLLNHLGFAQTLLLLLSFARVQEVGQRARREHKLLGNFHGIEVYAHRSDFTVYENGFPLWKSYFIEMYKFSIFVSYYIHLINGTG